MIVRIIPPPPTAITHDDAAAAACISRLFPVHSWFCYYYVVVLVAMATLVGVGGGAHDGDCVFGRRTKLTRRCSWASCLAPSVQRAWRSCRAPSTRGLAILRTGPATRGLVDRQCDDPIVDPGRHGGRVCRVRATNCRAVMSTVPARVLRIIIIIIIERSIVHGFTPVIHTNHEGEE
jgi:hypothetical protein